MSRKTFAYHKSNMSSWIASQTVDTVNLLGSQRVIELNISNLSHLNCVIGWMLILSNTHISPITNSQSLRRLFWTLRKEDASFGSTLPSMERLATASVGRTISGTIDFILRWCCNTHVTMLCRELISDCLVTLLFSNTAEPPNRKPCLVNIAMKWRFQMSSILKVLIEDVKK